MPGIFRSAPARTSLEACSSPKDAERRAHDPTRPKEGSSSLISLVVTHVEPTKQFLGTQLHRMANKCSRRCCSGPWDKRMLGSDFKPQVFRPAPRKSGRSFSSPSTKARQNTKAISSCCPSFETASCNLSKCHQTCKCDIQVSVEVPEVSLAPGPPRLP